MRGLHHRSWTAFWPMRFPFIRKAEALASNLPQIQTLNFKHLTTVGYMSWRLTVDEVGFRDYGVGFLFAKLKAEHSMFTFAQNNMKPCTPLTLVKQP